jgi:hypothetical protein
MHGLLDAATVLYGDGQWTIGYEVDALACGRNVEGSGICDPIPLSEDDLDDSGTGYKIEPFAVVGYQRFGSRCAPDDAEEALTQAIVDATEYTIGRNFWFGDVTNWAGADEGMFLADAGIATETVTGSVNTDIAAVVKKGFDRHPELDPVLHLGVGAALAIPNYDNLERIGIDQIVVNPAYPVDAIAVTGPILLRLGSVETQPGYVAVPRTNRIYISGTRIVAFEFDPCLAVVGVA